MIDNKLSWAPHVDYLSKKLKSTIGMLNRIKQDIPAENYKMLYHTLFESHMIYCITVFGGIANVYTEKLFRLQKHCMRILFGNRNAYLDKFRTCARAREYGNQILGSKFYMKEHTKPIFHKYGILAFKNCYSYHLCLQMFKLLVTQHPATIFKIIKQSTRNSGTLLIVPNIPARNVVYRGTVVWNIVAKTLLKKISLDEVKVGQLKFWLKNALLRIQNEHDHIEWYPHNFVLNSITKLKDPHKPLKP